MCLDVWVLSDVFYSQHYLHPQIFCFFQKKSLTLCYFAIKYHFTSIIYYIITFFFIYTLKCEFWILGNLRFSILVVLSRVNPRIIRTSLRTHEDSQPTLVYFYTGSASRIPNKREWSAENIWKQYILLRMNEQVLSTFSSLRPFSTIHKYHPGATARGMMHCVSIGPASLCQMSVSSPC